MTASLSIPSPLISVSSKWVAATPTPNILHVFYRHRLIEIFRLESPITSICLTEVKPVANVQIVVTTSDYRIWFVSATRRPKGTAHNDPVVSAVPRQSCIGVHPFVSGCVRFDNSDLLLHGPLASTCRAQLNEAKRRYDFIPVSRLSGHSMVTIVLLRSGRYPSRCSSGSVSVLVSPAVFDALLPCSENCEDTAILIEARRLGGVFLRSSSTERLLIDVEEDICNVHVVSHEGVLSLVIATGMGKIVWYPIDRRRPTRWFRIPVPLESSTVVAGLRLYVVSNHNLFAVDLIPAIQSNQALSSSSHRCQPLSLRQSSLQLRSAITTIVAADATSKELTAMTTSRTVLFLSTSTEDLAEPTTGISLKTALFNVKRLSDVKSKICRMSPLLDDRLRAVQFLSALKSSTNLMGMLSCGLEVLPVLQAASKALLLKFTLTNQSMLKLPSESFTLRVAVVPSIVPTVVTVKSYYIALREMASEETIEIPIIHSISSDQPLIVRLSLIFVGHLRGDTERTVPMQQSCTALELMSTCLDIIRLAKPSIISVPMRPSTASSLITARLPPAPKVQLPNATFSRLRMFRADRGATSDSTLAYDLSKLIDLTTTESAAGSIQRFSIYSSSLNLTVVEGNSSSMVDLFLQCSPASSMPVWRASIVARLFVAQNGLPDWPYSSEWRSIVENTLTSVHGDLQRFRCSEQDVIGEAILGPNATSFNIALDSSSRSSLAQSTIIQLLAAYQTFRTKITQQLPLC